MTGSALKDRCTVTNPRIPKAEHIKQMYMKLMDATENAMDILIAAQRQCEEIYIETEDPSDGEDA